MMNEVNDMMVYGYVKGEHTMKEYTVIINFNGFIGCDEEYVVDAESKEEAIEEAMEMARDDLEVVDVIEEDDEDDEDE